MLPLRPQEADHNIALDLIRYCVRLNETRAATRDQTLASFFGAGWNWTPLMIHMISQLERDWAIQDIPLRENQRAGLRYFIWTMTFPDPAVHYEEASKRLPLLAEYPRVRRYFIRNARGAPEPKAGNFTGKCPLCGSQLFGYPLPDHQGQECPFRDMSNPHRFEFMVCNNLAICFGCNARSATHYHCENPTKPCTTCDAPGHTAMSGLCGTFEATSVEALRTGANELRRRFYQRIRTAGNLRYNTIFDCSNYARFNRMRRGRPVFGTGPYPDPRLEFDNPANIHYFNPNGPTMYRGLNVPEYDHTLQMVEPEWTRDDLEFLVNMGEIVTRNRQYPMDDDRLDMLIADLRPEDQHPLHALEVHDEPEQPTAAPAQNAVEQDHLIVPQEEHEEQEHQGSMNSSWADQMEEIGVEAPILSQSAPIAEESPAELASDIEEVFEDFSSVSMEDEHEDHDAEKQDFLSVTDDQETVIEIPQARANSISRRFQASTAPQEHTSNLEELTEQQQHSLINLRALACCSKAYSIKGEPARSSYEKEAIQVATANGHPLHRVALVEKAQTLLTILTGGPDVDTYAYTDWSTDQIKAYIEGLGRYCDMLDNEPFLVIRFENQYDGTVLKKFSTGANSISVPSISLWQDVRLTAWKDIPVEQLNMDLYETATKQFYPIEYPKLAEGYPLTQNMEENPVQTHFSYDSAMTTEEVAEKMKELMGIPLPSSSTALAKRINTLISLLARRDFYDCEMPSSSEDVKVLADYVYMVFGASRCWIDNKERETATLEVIFTGCEKKLVEMVNTKHILALPKLELFKKVNAERWMVWNEIAWTELSDELRRTNLLGQRQCECNIEPAPLQL